MARPKCCCCGQILPKPEMFRLLSVGKTIYDFVSSHPEGVTRKEIFDHLYGKRPSGGPSVGYNIVNVHFARMNPLLGRKDLAIKSHRQSGQCRYTIRRVSTGNVWLPYEKGDAR